MTAYFCEEFYLTASQSYSHIHYKKNLMESMLRRLEVLINSQDNPTKS